MTQKIDLNKMGLAPLTESEMEEVDGGLNWLSWVGLAIAAVGAVVGSPFVAAVGIVITVASIVHNGDGTVTIQGQQVYPK